jgi:SAM-dependent methyltransferase
MKTLDVGCGDRKTEGAIGIDIVALPGVDVVHDLDVYPWPFEDGSFDKVFMLNIIEHLDDTIKAMREVHRILKPGGIVHIETCYWNYKHAFSDPTHKRFFTETTWDFFTGRRKPYYMDFVFEPVSFVWQYDYHLKFLPKCLKRFLGIFLCNVIEGMVVELRKPC